MAKTAKLVPWFEVTLPGISAIDHPEREQSLDQCRKVLYAAVKAHVEPLVRAAAEAKLCQVSELENGFAILKPGEPVPAELEPDYEAYHLTTDKLITVFVATAGVYSFADRYVIRLRRHVNGYGSGKVKEFDFPLVAPHPRYYAEAEAKVWPISVDLPKLTAKIASLLNEELTTWLQKQKKENDAQTAERHKAQFAGETLARIKQYNKGNDEGGYVNAHAYRVGETDVYRFSLELTSFNPESITFGGAIFPRVYLGEVSFADLTPEAVVEVLDALQRMKR